MIHQRPKLEQDVVIDKNNINQFFIRDNARHIRETNIDKITANLKSGQGLLLPVVVNRVGNINYVIDGNHRILTIRDFLDKFPEQIVLLNLAVFENLSFLEEKEMYDLASSGVNQNNNDFIKNHFDEFSINKFINEDFPIPVTLGGRENGVSYLWLYRLWYSRKQYSYHGLPKPDIISYVCTLTEEDVKEMRRFFVKYCATFGNPSNKSFYWSYGFIWLVISIIYRNNELYDEEKIWEVLSLKLFTFVKNFSPGRLGSAHSLLTTLRFNFLNNLKRNTFKKLV